METKFFLHEASRGVYELFFQLLKKPLGDPKAPWTDITVKAEKDHVARYHSSYKKFKKEHPDFVLQWSELEYVVVPEVPALLEASEHVEEKLEEAKKESKKKSK